MSRREVVVIGGGGGGGGRAAVAALIIALLVAVGFGFYLYRQMSGRVAGIGITIHYKDGSSYTVDISGSTYASATGKWNMPLVNIYLLTYDSGFAFPVAGKPADITGIGTSTVTKYLKWYAEISAEKKVVAIYKVVLTANTTDISKIKLKKLNIPGVGYLDGSSFVQDVLSDQIKWTYTISNNILYGADYIERPVNDPNEFKFTTVLELNLASGDVIQVTLTVYYLTPIEVSAVISDSVLLSAS